MQIVNNTQLAILEALGRFQYMTAAQLMAWGVTRNKRHLYAVLSGLEGKASSPIKKINFGVIAGVGRLHSIYYLTLRGVELLQDAGVDRIQHPSKAVTFTRDYFHRLGCIDLHIAFEKWARETGGEISRFETYYDRTGRSLRGYPAPKTTIQWHDNKITPDLMCMAVDHEHKPRLCAIELHRGRAMLRLDKQLMQYSEAVKIAAIENAYDYPSAARILLIFDNPEALETCKKRIAALSFSGNFNQRLFLNTDENIAADLLHGWQGHDGQKRVLW